MARFEVRLPDEELERWRVAAQAAGWSIATLVKRSVAALLAVQRLPDGGVQGPQPFLASSSVSTAIAGAMRQVEQNEAAGLALDEPIASSELQSLTDDGEPTGRRTIHRHFPDGSVVTTETTAASEAAQAAARLPDPAPATAKRQRAAETVCVHRVPAGSYCKQCGKQCGKQVGT
jgi:hypothetical protein